MNDFNTAKANAQVLLGDANASQAQIDNANQQLAAAIAALTTDKQPVQNVINSVGTQPQYVQDDPAVKQALFAAKAVNDAANPSVEEVRAKADALANAIGQAVASEVARQDAATDSLRTARDKLNNQNLGQDEMPNIDITAIEQKVNAVKDDAVRNQLVADLNNIRAALATRQAQINARKAQPRASEGEHKKPHVSSTRLSDTGESTTLIAVIGTVATFGGGALLLARWRQQGDR